LKCLDEEGIGEIVKLCNRMYVRGEWPKDFMRTVMIPIPKKSGTRKCKEHRTISLICHAAKIMLRILNRRLASKMKENIGEEQFGFVRGRGTRDAIGLIRTVDERYMERGKAVSMCFVDLEKAFDRVNWRKLMDILKVKKVDWRDRRLIEQLYRKQEVAVRIGEMKTEWVKVGRGVRQGCCMSPTLFNMYEEEMLNEWFEEQEGSNMGGRKISCVRFADDMVIIEENEEKLQEMIARLEEKCEEYGMKVNVKKTKVLRIGDKERVKVKASGERIEQVKEFRYLGTRLTSEWTSEGEIRMRIAMAKEAFTRKKRILCSGRIK
jgi:retron-type reverse transcriptase